MNEALLPCPFCGSTNPDLIDELAISYVECSGCSMTGPARINAGAAVEAWNKRAALHADQARDARIQALEDVGKALRQAREILVPLRSARQLNPYGLLGQYGDKAANAVAAIDALLAQATQPVPGGKELP